MSSKRKYNVRSRYMNHPDETHNLKIIVTDDSVGFGHNVTFTAKTRKNDEGYLPHARNMKVFEIIDNGNGVIIPDSNSDKIYLDYSEVAALKAILAVDDKINSVRHVVKMKSIKPEGASVAYQGDPADNSLKETDIDHCINCQYSTPCHLCKYYDQ